MWDDLWKKGADNCIQFSFCNRLEFTKTVPQFNAGKAVDIPIHPGYIRLSESWHGRVHWMCKEAKATQPMYSAYKGLWAICQSRHFLVCAKNEHVILLWISILVVDFLASNDKDSFLSNLIIGVHPLHQD